MTANCIEKQIDLNAPIARVWRALTDYREFGEWFKVSLEGPFVPGQLSSGQITYPGYEHIRWEANVEQMEPQRLFSFRWAHPKSFEKGEAPADYSKEPTTVVGFKLEQIPGGTRLTVSECGFDGLPNDRRDEAFKRNEGGWTEQVKNLEAHLAKHP
jgi:uncharacterized protein YndB with AHSA1/START domain